MGKTSKRGYRVIVEPTKACYPKAETVKPRRYELNQTNLSRLNVEPAKSKQGHLEEDWKTEAAFRIALFALLFAFIVGFFQLFNGY